MKRLFVLLAVLAATALFAAPAFAGYGSWEITYDGLGAPPGFSSSGFLGVAAGDTMNVYTAGVHQNGALTAINGWASTDGGYHFTGISGWDFEHMTNECDMMQIMNMYIDVESTGPDNVQLAGMGVDQECLDENPFPACMFICMFALQPDIKYSDDGGETWTQSEITSFPLMSMVNAIDYATDEIGYAVGGPRLLLRTQDGGQVWNRINAPGDGAEVYYNDVAFLNQNLGFVVLGNYEETVTVRDKENPTIEEARAWQQWAVHRARYLRDPVYRLEYRRENPDLVNGKGINGEIYRTTDGGRTWDLVLSDAYESFIWIKIVDEDNIWAMSDPHTYVTHTFGLWHSTDGGLTWDDVTSTVPVVTDPNAVSAMTFQPGGNIGFLGGASQVGFAYKALLFYTEDGGATWTRDQDVVPFGHPIIAMDFAGPKTAYAACFDLVVYKYTQDNVGPLADAGDDQTVMVGDIVVLDGSGSSDADDDPITFLWEADGVTFVDATADATTFVAEAAGEITVTLTVSDATESDTDEVVITVLADGDDDTADDDDADDDDADDDTGDDDTGDDDTTTDDDTTLPTDDDDEADGDDDDDDAGACGC